MELVLRFLVICLLSKLLVSQDAKRFDHSVQQLFELYTSNQRLLDGTRQRDIQIIYPQQIRKNEVVGISTKEHRIRHHGAHEHYKHVTFQMDINNVRYKMKLDLNEALLSSGIMVKHYIDRNQQVISKTIEHCYYHGTVKKDEWSAVAVSTCNGIRGVIQLHNVTYIIQPLLGGDEGLKHPHVLYKATVSDSETCGNGRGQWLPFKELHKGEYVRRLKYLKAQQQLDPNPSGPPILDPTVDPVYLHLALVFDTSVYQTLNLTHPEMVTYAIQTANIVDMYYKDLNIRVSLVYAELWNVVDQFKVSSVLRETLENFLHFKENNLKNIDHDIAQFVTSRPFADNSIGLAIPDSICTDRAVGVNKNPDTIEPQQVATVLAHMIGHNLGLKHDEDEEWRLDYYSGECECSDIFGCIMSYRVLEFRGFHSRMFSSCSLKDLDISIKMGLGSCLLKKNERKFVQRCGNGYVERGEECDCGSKEDCVQLDPCCDPNTCLLKSWATCRSGPCCNNCTLYPSTHVCRDKTTECDVPEFCTGQAGECPSNNFIQDGQSCANDTGFCYGGICPTRDIQCQTIWGDESSSADYRCFERFNPTGNFNGHCGRDEKTGHYIKCQAENSPCGLLHCNGGNRAPFFGPDKAFSKTTVFSGGVEYDCKIVHGPAALDLPHMGMVQDGTKCGDTSVCLDSTCVPLTTLAVLRCAANSLGVECSNQGICTRAGTCFCYPGWGSSACDIEVEIITQPLTTAKPTTRKTTVPRVNILTQITNGGMVTTSPKPTSTNPSQAVLKDGDDGLSTTWLVVILASVVGGLVLVIGLIMACYRRKTPNKSSLTGSKNNIFTGQNSSLLKKKDDGSKEKKSLRLISFGSLPSYRLGKGKKKGKKSRMTSEEESDIGELPPPPIIITSPNSAKPPEKGILKNSMISKKFQEPVTNTSEDTNTDDNNDCELGSRSSLSLTQCMGDDNELEDDDEDAELRQILEGSASCYLRDHDHNYDGVSNLHDGFENHYALPAPGSSMFESPLHSPALSFASSGRNGSISYSRRGSNNSGRENGIPSPARAKHLRLRPLEDMYGRAQPTYVDLSPSPEDMIGEHKISPCTSDDIRNSETEVDRDYLQGSNYADNTPPSKYPYSVNRDDKRFRRDPQPTTSDAAGLGLSKIPKLSPLRFEKFLLHARSNYDPNRGMRASDDDSNLNTSDLSSHHGTGNSRSGCEKSSGYGSEQDPDRKSIEDMVSSRSRSRSKSPPNFSNVIRAGPNRIQLVPSLDRDAPLSLPPPRQPPKITYSANDRLQKLLEGLPRINAGSFERSPLPPAPSCSSSSSGSSRGSVVGVPVDPSPVAKPRLLQQTRKSNRDSGPCIDRSLDEIPQVHNDTDSDEGSSLVEEEVSPNRPSSLDVFQKPSLTHHNNLNTQASGTKLDTFTNKQYSGFKPDGSYLTN